MNNRQNADDPSDIPKTLIELGTYEWPQGATQQTLKLIFEKITNKLPWFHKRSEISDHKLRAITQHDQLQSAHARLERFLFDCLDHGYSDWINKKGHKKRAFVVSPMASDLLEDWAKENDLQTISQLEELESLSPDQPAVLPKLETHLSRRHDALPILRSYLSDFAETDARLLVGCNSWAWRYLATSTSINLLFQAQHTLPPFDADALAELIGPVFEEERNLETLLSKETGEPVFAREKCELKDPYFPKLATRSLGLPWIAIEMFFNDLLAADEAETTDGDQRAWLTLPASATLPEEHADLSCIALQNLLIHGPCSQATLNTYLPRELPPGVWTALEDCGFISRKDGLLHHRPNTYPAIRSALGAAGMNLDRL